MNYFHTLTLIFVGAKIFNYIDWSWWVVFAPSIASIAIVFLILAGVLFSGIKTDRYL
jgi:hypothetical protein